MNELIEACQANNIYKVKLLLFKKHNPNIFVIINNVIWTPLKIAFLNMNYDMMSALLEAGAVE